MSVLATAGSSIRQVLSLSKLDMLGVILDPLLHYPAISFIPVLGFHHWLKRLPQNILFPLTFLLLEVWLISSTLLKLSAGQNDHISHFIISVSIKRCLFIKHTSVCKLQFLEHGSRHPLWSFWLSESTKGRQPIQQKCETKTLYVQYMIWGNFIEIGELSRKENGCWGLSLLTDINSLLKLRQMTVLDAVLGCHLLLQTFYSSAVNYLGNFMPRGKEEMLLKSLYIKSQSMTH